MSRVNCAEAICGKQMAGKVSQQKPRYNSVPARSRAFRKIIPGRPDRRPPQPPAYRPGSCDAAALGLLVSILALQDGAGLGPRQRAKAWRYVDGWARQVVEDRQSQEAA